MTPADILEATSELAGLPYDDGALVLEHDVRHGALFVLVDGVLEVQRNGLSVALIREPGAVVGELGLLLDSPASADVRAVGPVTVRRIDDVEEFFVRYPEFSRSLATMLARRLWQVSTYLSDLQEQFAHRPDILGLIPAVIEDLLGDDRAQPDVGSDRETESPY